MILSDLHFLRPLFLWALPLVAFIIVWLQRSRHSSRSWANVCDRQLLPFLLADAPGRHRTPWAPWLVGITTSLLILALAGPTWERLPQPVFRDQSALVIALDLSRSMDAGDIKPSRLARARHKITDILELRQGGQTALLVYAGDAFAVTPLTDDQGTIIAQLPSLDTDMMPRQGSRVDHALNKATELLKQAGATSGHILLVTDGIDETANDSLLKTLRKQGHKLSILGTGTREGAPIPLGSGGFLKDQNGAIVVPKLNSVRLRDWATRSGGRYTQIQTDDRDIRYLLETAELGSLDQAEQATGMQSDQWRELGPWLILLVIPVAALAFRRGILLVLFALLLPLPPPAHAIDWNSLWRNADQRGSDAFTNGDTASAAQHFKDPQWKAAAQYRNGDYAGAAASLENIETPDALYNRGNAQAKLGQFDEASASYRQALELDPNHEDAKHNLKLLQQPSSDQQSSENQDDSPEQQGDESQSQQGDKSDQEGQPSSESESASESDASQDEKKQSASSESSQSTPDQTDDHQQSSANEGSSEPRDEEPADQQQAAADQGQREDDSNPATEQWLRRIPDDPGGLLRRKFLYQYQQRGQRSPQEDKQW